jgi:hypothetical protein
MQSRESGREVQGRDRSAHHVFRSSMSDPVYYTRSSMTDPSYPGPQRGMVTPQVNVAEGVRSLCFSLYCSSCAALCCAVLCRPCMTPATKHVNLAAWSCHTLALSDSEACRSPTYIPATLMGAEEAVL